MSDLPTPEYLETVTSLILESVNGSLIVRDQDGKEIHGIKEIEVIEVKRHSGPVHLHEANELLPIPNIFTAQAVFNTPIGDIEVFSESTLEMEVPVTLVGIAL